MDNEEQISVQKRINRHKMQLDHAYSRLMNFQRLEGFEDIAGKPYSIQLIMLMIGKTFA